jgi:hypothetical protein
VSLYECTVICSSTSMAETKPPDTASEKSGSMAGPRDALIRTIRRGKNTDGLKLLAANDRLDCAYEQIAIDHADEMPEDVVERARQTVAEYIA